MFRLESWAFILILHSHSGALTAIAITDGPMCVWIQMHRYERESETEAVPNLNGAEIEARTRPS